MVARKQVPDSGDYFQKTPGISYTVLSPDALLSVQADQIVA